MDAVKYLKERKRMCKNSVCFDCPFYEKKQPCRGKLCVIR